MVRARGESARGKNAKNSTSCIYYGSKKRNPRKRWLQDVQYDVGRMR